MKHENRHRFPMLAGVFLLTLILLCPGLSSSQEIIYVDIDNDDCTEGCGTEENPWKYIQDAINEIDVSGYGDTILVAQGTYLENIDFRGLPISIISRDGPEVTIIDGSDPDNLDYGSTVIFISGEDDASRLEGFTITGGTGSLAGSYYQAGGGIYCEGSSPDLSNCVLHGNTAQWGGGLYCDNASPEMDGVAIYDNTVDSYNSAGGGVYCSNESSPTLSGCEIFQNHAIYSSG